MKWIDIYSKESGRVSSFRDSDKSKGKYLEVVGELPHNYQFEPNSVRDANALITWLHIWIDLKKGVLKNAAS